MNKSVWSTDGMIVTRKIKSTWRKTSKNVSTTNPKWTGLGFCGEKLVTNHLTNGIWI
jgi:hypothetical protein